MEELIEKIENLEDKIKDLDFVKELDILQKEIENDENLSKLLKEYKSYPTKEGKEVIIKHPLFQKYKEKETDLNILILDMNQRLKEITKNRNCIL